MMTFLPFADFAASAASLDMRRLQNQRTEARFVLEWLEQTGSYFDLSDYGAARMWQGFRDALALYYNAMLEEYSRRGKTNGPTMQPAHVPAQVDMPPWIGDARFHSSHRAVLLQKDAAHYGAFGWAEAEHAEWREYLYPHRMEDGRWGLYPQSKYKKRTIVAIAHGERVDGAAVEPTRAQKRSAPPRACAEADADDDEEEDVPLIFRAKRAKQTSAAAESRAYLTGEWERLTKRVLPQRASAEQFPIRWDHCFQRVALDFAFGGCWYDHLDRKKGAAIKQIATPALAKAVAAARRMEAEGVGAVREMDAQSLLWRGKQPKQQKKAA